MTTFAVAADVAVSLGRPITDSAEIAQVSAWLERVESRIRRRIPSLNTLALDAGYLSILKGIEVDVVVRRVNNPTEKQNERIDDYSYGLTATAAASDLWPTESEWVELRPRRSTGAFTVRPQFGS